MSGLIVPLHRGLITEPEVLETCEVPEYLVDGGIMRQHPEMVRLILYGDRANPGPAITHNALLRVAMPRGAFDRWLKGLQSQWLPALQHCFAWLVLLH